VQATTIVWPSHEVDVFHAGLESDLGDEAGVELVGGKRSLGLAWAATGCVPTAVQGGKSA